MVRVAFDYCRLVLILSCFILLVLYAQISLLTFFKAATAAVRRARDGEWCSTLDGAGETWQCNACTLFNNAGNTHCAACLASRPATPAASGGPAGSAAGVSHMWICRACTLVNQMPSTVCSACRAPALTNSPTHTSLPRPHPPHPPRQDQPPAAFPGPAPSPMPTPPQPHHQPRSGTSCCNGPQTQQQPFGSSTWACSSCSISNIGGTRCVVCLAQRPAALVPVAAAAAAAAAWRGHSTQPSSSAQLSQLRPALRGPAATAATADAGRHTDAWACRRCTFYNASNTAACAVCDLSRSSSATVIVID